MEEKKLSSKSNADHLLYPDATEQAFGVWCYLIAMSRDKFSLILWSKIGGGEGRILGYFLTTKRMQLNYFPISRCIYTKAKYWYSHIILRLKLQLQFESHSN